MHLHNLLGSDAAHKVTLSGATATADILVTSGGLLSSEDPLSGEKTPTSSSGFFT